MMALTFGVTDAQKVLTLIFEGSAGTNMILGDILVFGD